MKCSMPGLHVHHQLLESTQTHVHRVDDAIQASHALSSPSPPAPSLLCYYKPQNFQVTISFFVKFSRWEPRGSGLQCVHSSDVEARCHDKAETLCWDQEHQWAHQQDPQVSPGPSMNKRAPDGFIMCSQGRGVWPLVKGQKKHQVLALEWILGLSRGISSNSDLGWAPAKSPGLLKNQQVKPMAWSY